PSPTHVCRTTREAAFSTLCLRHSSIAGFAVPFRRFMPAIDTLYMGLHQIIATLNFLGRPENASLARQLRRMAIEVSCMTGTELSHVSGFILKHALSLQTLSLVLPGTCDIPAYGMLLLPPARRCRLRDIPEAMVNELKVTSISFPRENETLPMPLRVYFARQRGRMPRSIHAPTATEDERTAWSAKDGPFSRFELKAQTFVEYRYFPAAAAAGGIPQEEWVEVCKERLLGGNSPEQEDSARAPTPRPIPRADRKDPEQYRVLDDDNGRWYTWGELRPTLPQEWVGL
ncbi:hypothetical protein C8A05DRAFT_20661, partial [Staphylotrichum tortipilum]